MLVRRERVEKYRALRRIYNVKIKIYYDRSGHKHIKTLTISNSRKM